MSAGFETIKAQLREAEAQRRQECLEAFRERCGDWACGDCPLSTLCQEAGDALESFALKMLEMLLSSTATVDERTTLTAWIVERYHESISVIGAAIRDEIADQHARHAVAQTLQERLLRVELRLRQVTQCAEPSDGPTSAS